MALLLTEHAEHRKLSGSHTFVVPAGKTIKVEWTPAGEEVMAVVVPAGKTWSVSVVVDIEETDA